MAAMGETAEVEPGWMLIELSETEQPWSVEDGDEVYDVVESIVEEKVHEASVKGFAHVSFFYCCFKLTGYYNVFIYFVRVFSFVFKVL